MKVTKNSAVTFEYTLKSDSGEVIDTSEGAEPLAYLHGHGNIVPGLENALEGKQAGDSLTVKVAPAEGYGEYDTKQIQVVSKAMFKKVDDVQVGMQFYAGTEENMHMVTVTKIEGDNVTIDANHPLAGQNLNFDVKVREVRAATAEEIAHGHIHGPGGHHH